MGSFRSANIACMEGYKNGVETCIEVMVVTSWFPEAARLLRENPGDRCRASPDVYQRMG